MITTAISPAKGPPADMVRIPMIQTQNFCTKVPSHVPMQLPPLRKVTTRKLVSCAPEKGQCNFVIAAQGVKIQLAILLGLLLPAIYRSK